MNLKFIKKLSFLTILMSLFAFNAFAASNADIQIDLTPSGGLVPCNVANSTENVRVTAKKGLSNIQITFTLPTGIEYVSGSVTGGVVTEDASSTATVPVFNVGTMTQFQILNFGIGAQGETRTRTPRWTLVPRRLESDSICPHTIYRKKVHLYLFSNYALHF